MNGLLDRSYDDKSEKNRFVSVKGVREESRSSMFSRISTNPSFLDGFGSKIHVQEFWMSYKKQVCFCGFTFGLTDGF